MNINVSNLMYTGVTTVSGSAPTVLGTSQELKRGVTIVAGSGTTPIVTIGNSGITVGNGFELLPRQSLFIPVDNVNLIYGITPGTSVGKLYWFGN